MSRTREIDYAIAQLRHAYALLLSCSVVDHRRFAQGMLGPVIERLERLADPGGGDPREVMAAFGSMRGMPVDPEDTEEPR